MPTGLSVLCFIHPDSRNLIIWFRSPEQSRSQRHRQTDRQTEKSNKTTKPTILLTRSQYIWHDLCTCHSILFSWHVFLQRWRGGEGSRPAPLSLWHGFESLVPDPSVVNFYHLPSDTTWYHHTFYWSGVVVLKRFCDLAHSFIIFILLNILLIDHTRCCVSCHLGHKKIYSVPESQFRDQYRLSIIPLPYCSWACETNAVHPR